MRSPAKVRGLGKAHGLREMCSMYFCEYDYLRIFMLGGVSL